MKEIFPEFPKDWDDKEGPPPGWEVVDTSQRYPGTIFSGELMRGYPHSIVYRHALQKEQPKQGKL